ncbi:MAG: ATPase [Alphaproteobacteria bacterium]|jgi:chaperone required for assembly of F1-ATPase|nr:ATPase [Alphaproteobacteria bacterium]
MSEWVKKRFWTEVSVAETDDGFAILLDGRGVKTPAKAGLVVPTHAFAEIVAEEWRAQADTIDPSTMPATRAANAALDNVRGQMAEVAGLITDYGDSDLVCYRAEAPDSLVALEAEAWGPIIDWAAHRYGVRPVVRYGVVHEPQPAALLAELRADVARLTAFELTCFHDLVAMSGSLMIALAVIDGFDQPGALWTISRVDEDWQISQWGSDEEAEALAKGRRRAFMDAARFFFALQQAA